jgi:hypothetical protein
MITIVCIHKYIIVLILRMGTILDKCCCSNETKLGQYEDFNAPDLVRGHAPVVQNAHSYQLKS